MENFLIFKPDGTKTVRLGCLAQALDIPLPELKEQSLHLCLKEVMKQVEAIQKPTTEAIFLKALKAKFKEVELP